MSAYYQGNLALEERAAPKSKVRETRKTVKRKVSITTGEKLLYLFAILICVAVAGAIIMKSSQIYQINTKIQQIEQEIEKLEKENSTLRVDIRKLQEPKRLIEYGRQFGLVPSGEEAVKQVLANRDYYASDDSKVVLMSE